MSLSSRFRRNVAIVVGINDYQDGVPILKTPVNDAQTLAEILQTHHDYQVHVVLNQDAKRHHLTALLEGLFQQIEASDRLLFYFAGHGIALNGEDGPEGYLIPQDARLGEVSTYLSMSQVHNALLQLPCSHFLGILDCCFAGSFRWSSLRKFVPMDLGVIHKERFDRFIQDPAWQVITSAAHDQTALDAFDLQCRRMQSGQHSPFAAALIEALQGGADAYPPAELGKPAGDGVITATELYLYLRDRVEIATEMISLRQTPGIHSLKKHDKGEYIFLTPGHELNLPPAPPLDESKNPYRGLRSFEEKHCELFFGRSELIEKLHNFVKAHSLTVVLGASGSGKSSLVKAGLIPKLKQEAQRTGKEWCILAPIRPGEAPFQALNNALTKAQLATVELHNPQKTLVQSMAVWAKKHPHSRLFIFIDQSEEIITLCPDETERQEFFHQILTAIDAHRDCLQIVLSLRSDFEPQVRDTGLKFVPEAFNKLGHAELKNRWQRGRFMIPAMTRAELREAIEKPAEARVMYFQPHNLVEHIIEEVADMPGALPLLSFALSELYLKYLKRQQAAQHQGILIDRALTQADHHELGGVIQSLTQRADEEYQALVQADSAYIPVICHVMLRMVALGGGELARRRVPLSELEYPPEKNVLVKGVIERFSQARLLVEGQNAEGQPYVEPAHDALVRGWGKLQTWLTAEKNLALQRRLTPAAVEWKERQQASFLWDTDPYLEVLNEVCHTSENNWLNQTEMEFVQSSLRRKRNNLRRLVATVTGVILALSGFALFAGYQWRQADIRTIEALTQSAKAKFTANRHSADGLIDALESGTRLQALSWRGLSQELQANVLETLAQSVYWVREQNRWQGHQNVVQAVAYSPDGRVFATASYDDAVKLWHPDGRWVMTLKGHTKPVMSINFSPDGQTIATGSQDGMVKLWNRRGSLIQTIPAHQKTIYSVRFSPDGQTIITGSQDSTAKLWNRNGKLLKTLSGHRDSVRFAGFSLDGQRIVTTSSDSTVKLWRRNGALQKTLTAHSDRVTSADFSPDGRILATASDDRTVKLWSQEGQLLQTFDHLHQVWSVRFSHDGQTIASGSGDGQVSLWSRNGGQLNHWNDRLLDTWNAHNGPIPGLDFSPDDQTLATVSNDNFIKLWQVNRNRLTVVVGHPESVNSVQFSPNGKRIASGSDDGTVRIWNSAGKLLTPLKVEGSVHGVSFSPNGRLIAAASTDTTIKLWAVEGQLLNTLKGHRDVVRDISFSPNGRIIASASEDETAKLWSLDGAKRTTLKGHQGRVLSISFSPDGQTIATAGDDQTVQLWSLDGKELKTLQGHTNRVRQAGFSPDGKMIVSASSDRTVKLWNLEINTVKTLRGHRDALLAVSFSPDGKVIASASSDRTVKIWQRDGTLITTLHGHQIDVNAVSFSPNSQWLVTSDFSGAVLLWNVSNLTLSRLMQEGCSQIRNYLQTQPNRLYRLCNER